MNEALREIRGRWANVVRKVSRGPKGRQGFVDRKANKGSKVLKAKSVLKV